MPWKTHSITKPYRLFILYQTLPSCKFRITHSWKFALQSRIASVPSEVQATTQVLLTDLIHKQVAQHNPSSDQHPIHSRIKHGSEKDPLPSSLIPKLLPIHSPSKTEMPVLLEAELPHPCRGRTADSQQKPVSSARKGKATDMNISSRKTPTSLPYMNPRKVIGKPFSSAASRSLWSDDKCNIWVFSLSGTSWEIAASSS